MDKCGRLAESAYLIMGMADDDFKNKIKMKESEHQIQTMVMRYLQYKGFFVLRLNSGVIPIENKEGKQRRIWLSRPGTPDLMAFRKKKTAEIENPLELLFIEVKKPGRKPAWQQQQMMKELEEKGARCYVVHSLEEMQEILEKGV